MEVKINKEQVVEIVQVAGSIASSFGCVALITGVTRVILPKGVNKIVQGAMIFGGTVLGGFISNQMTDYLNEEIESTIDFADDTFQAVKKKVKRDLDVLRDKDIEETPES